MTHFPNTRIDIFNEGIGGDVASSIAKRLDKVFEHEPTVVTLTFGMNDSGYMDYTKAENRIISMINENEITKKAYEKKAEIIETANEMSREISKGTKDYADNILQGLEVALEDALKIIQNNRKELK